MLYLSKFNEYIEALETLEITFEEWKVRRILHIYYYMIFHKLLSAASLPLIKGLDLKNDVQKKLSEKVYRTPTHTQCKEFMKKISNDQNFSYLKKTSDFFPKIQSLREEADYNPLPLKVTQSDLESITQQFELSLKEINEVFLDEHKCSQLTLALHFKDRR